MLLYVSNGQMMVLIFAKLWVSFSGTQRAGRLAHICGLYV